MMRTILTAATTAVLLRLLHPVMDCLVTQDDCDKAINDIRESMGTHDDHTEEDSSSSSDDNNLSTTSTSSSHNIDTTSSDDLLDGNHVSNGVIIDDVVKDNSII